MKNKLNSDWLLVALIMIQAFWVPLSFYVIDKVWTPNHHANSTLVSSTSTYQSLCESQGTSCRKALLQVINNDRKARGLYKYSINWNQVHGNSVCVGTHGHSQAMAQSGFIWHVNPNYVSASFPNDICGWPYTAEKPLPKAEPIRLREKNGVKLIPAVMLSDHEGVVTSNPNVGLTTIGENAGASSGNKWQAVQLINTEMMNEGPSGGHYQNLMSGSFSQIAIDIEYSNGQYYLTEDFTG
jgi:uncharacterized protein YkwD